MDEDILAFNRPLWEYHQRHLGKYFDGSAFGLGDTNNEDIDALDVGPNGDIYLSTIGVFAVTGVAGDDEDVFVVCPPHLGNRDGLYVLLCSLFRWQHLAKTSNDVDAFNLLDTGPIPTPLLPTRHLQPTHHKHANCNEHTGAV